METKSYTSCKLNKPITDFYKNCFKCKPCEIMRVNQWRLNNPEKYLQKSKGDEMKEKLKEQFVSNNLIYINEKV